MRMKLHRIALITGLSQILLACASKDAPPAPPPPEPRAGLTVHQAHQRFEFCQTDRCPIPTLKSMLVVRKTAALPGTPPAGMRITQAMLDFVVYEVDLKPDDPALAPALTALKAQFPGGSFHWFVNQADSGRLPSYRAATVAAGLPEAAVTGHVQRSMLATERELVGPDNNQGRLLAVRNSRIGQGIGGTFGAGVVASVTEAERFMAEYVRLHRGYDAKLASLYSPSARIITRQIMKTGAQRESVTEGSALRKTVQEVFPAVAAAGAPPMEFGPMTYAAEPGGFRVTGRRSDREGAADLTWHLQPIAGKLLIASEIAEIRQ